MIGSKNVHTYTSSAPVIAFSAAMSDNVSLAEQETCVDSESEDDWYTIDIFSHVQSELDENNVSHKQLFLYVTRAGVNRRTFLQVDRRKIDEMRLLEKMTFTLPPSNASFMKVKAKLIDEKSENEILLETEQLNVPLSVLPQSDTKPAVEHETAESSAVTDELTIT
ncbi:uncharacterized protein [Porites lutea]|uniref:uncharacterized protein isoform X4 n=1 Tax=Porites lutea TaxID=51062 RepID=UPI003CC54FCB